MKKKFAFFLFLLLLLGSSSFNFHQPTVAADVKKYHAEDSPFGITSQELMKAGLRNIWPEIFGDLNEIGAKRLRFFIDWSLIEPEENKWDEGVINYFSQALKDFKNHGIEPYIVISNGFPDWAMTDEHKDCGETQELWGIYTCHYPPKDINEWNEFVAKIVDTWGYGSNGKKLIRHWEILWEENAGWDTPAGYFYDHPEEYVNLLRNSNEIVKAIDPSAKIVFGRLLHQPPYARKFLNKILDLGGGDCFDVFNFGGPYKYLEAENLGDRVDTYRSILSSYGYEKEVWATEVHCASDIDINGTTDPEGEQVQAEALRILLTIAKEKDIVMFWDCYRDRVNFPKLGKRASGLVRDDYSKKPSYYAYKEIATGEATPSPIPGDANGDGIVDRTDLELLKEDYLGTPAHNTDFNSDGRVDIQDFAVLQSNYKENQ